MVVRIAAARAMCRRPPDANNCRIEITDRTVVAAVFLVINLGEASPNHDVAARSGDHGHHVLAAPHERLNAGSVIIHAREEVVEG